MAKGSKTPHPLVEKLAGRVDHLLHRGCHVLAYRVGCLDPLAVMGLLYTKAGKHRKLDLYVFEDSETAERKSSIKAFLGSSSTDDAADKGNYYIDKVTPVASKAELLKNVGVKDDKLIFTEEDYTSSAYSYYHVFKDGFLEDMDPPLPAELVTGYEKGPNFRRVSGEAGPARRAGGC
jgi:hypothetical protein